MGTPNSWDITIEIGPTSFDNLGKATLFSTHYYPITNINTELSDGLVQNDGGVFIFDTKDNSFITHSNTSDTPLPTYKLLSGSNTVNYSGTPFVTSFELKEGGYDVKNLQIIFTDDDISEHNDSSNIDIIFDEQTQTIDECLTEFDGNNFNFNCECSRPIGFLVGPTNNFESLCSPLDFGIISAGYGSNLSTDIIRTSRAFVFDGTSAYASIDYRTQINIPVSMSYGSSISSVNLLSTFYSLSKNISDSTTARASLVYNPRASFTPVMAYGSTTTTKLSATRRFTPAINSGTTASAVLSYRPSMLFAATISHGSTVTTNVANTRIFTPAISSGTTSTANLTYIPRIVFASTISHGSIATTDVAPTIILSPNVAFGHSLSFDITPQYAVYLTGTMFSGTHNYSGLSIYPSIHIKFDAYQGEVFDNNVSILPSLEVGAQFGHNITSTLNTNTTLAHTYVDGTTTTATILYVPPVLFTVNNSVGETGNIDITSSITLSPLNATGENVLLDLTYFISSGSEVDAHTGTTFNADITTYSLIKTDVHVGSILNTELGIRPPSYLSANIYSGTHSFAIPNVTVGLSFAATNGENVNTVAIDNLKNTYVYYGDEVSVELSSQTTLRDAFAHGEYVSATLKTGPSEPLGTFTFAHGSYIDYGLTVFVSTTFTPRFSFNTEFVQTIWDTTFVDLNTIACCAPKLTDLLNINLQHNKEVEVRYDIPRDVAVNIDMRTTPIFYPKVSYGTTMSVVEYDMLLSGSFTYGDELDTLDLYNDLVVDLNNGNPDYGDDDVLLETSKDYTQFTNTFTSIADGSELNIELSVSHGLASKMYIGWTMYPADFVIERAWRINFYSAFGMRATLNGNTQFHIYARAGDTTRLSGFYEDPLLFAAGEIMSAELVTDYDVGFIDDGCLDNGHIPTTSEGIPIFDPSNEMAVEGQYYSRYIKGRCF